MPETLGPILTANLFPEVEDRLLSLLRSFTPADWDRPTIVPKWKVREVVAHLLDTQLRKLTIVRDGFAPTPPNITSDADLVAFVNRLNAEGVAFYSGLSTPVLIALMETASRESCAFHQSLEPFAKAAFPVSWAGESESLNWFDTARELTERWHHQQQIRLAANKPGLMERHLYYPVLDCFMRSLPFSYREVQAAPGSQIKIEVSGESGGQWHLYRDQDRWRLITAMEGEVVAEIGLLPEIAWRVFTKGISRQDAIAASTCDGRKDLVDPFFRTIAIIG